MSLPETPRLCIETAVYETNWCNSLYKSRSVCNCTQRTWHKRRVKELEKINQEKVNFKQWKKVKMNDGKERMKIVDIEAGKNEFKEEMRKQFEQFKGHVDRVKAQYTLSEI